MIAQRLYLALRLADAGRYRRGLAFAAIALALGVWSGCTGQVGGDESGATGARCVSTRERYLNDVYGPVLQPKCASCHTPGGASSALNSKFLLARDSYPDFVTTNIQRLRDYAKVEVSGQPMLLLKALGQEKHGGGAVLTEGSAEYNSLASFVSSLRGAPDQLCADGAGLDVSLLSFRQRYRKAAILLAARVPKAAELDAVTTDETLAAAVVKLTEEEPFYEFLRETWNDELLTQRAVDAESLRSYGHAPDLYDDKDPAYTSEKRQWANVSLTEEPLRLIEHVARTNKPFSEILTADYVLANPWLARGYGFTHDKAMTPENVNAWKPFTEPLKQLRMSGGVAQPSVVVPRAGVLTTPSFLNRWETTRTNKGRKRARVVMKSFLATDIFKFAQRTVDAGILTAGQNATRNAAECNVCHATLDPIAGGFRGFSEDTLTIYSADDKWHDDLFAPGFGTTLMPGAEYTQAPRWLAAQVVADARFGLAVAHVMYRGLVGDEPLSFPTDSTSADYAERSRAFNTQNDWFVKLAADFKTKNYNLRALTAAVVNSVYFASVSGDAAKDALQASLGQGRLLTANLLARKYLATTGMYFFENGGALPYVSYYRATGYVRGPTDLRANYIAGDETWNSLLGGIDSKDVLRRADSVSPTMHASHEYMAATLACRATSFEFTKPAAARRLFASVEPDVTPFVVRKAESEAQTVAAGSEAKIRAAIVALHWRLLGEELAPDSEEVSRTYAFFVDVWKDLEKADLSKAPGNTGKGFANYRCNAQVDFDAAPVPDGNNEPKFPKLQDRTAGAPYVFGQVLTEDPNYTIRAWQAVLTYLLSDYRFDHE